MVAEAFIHQLSHFPLVEGCVPSILVCTCLWPSQLLKSSGGLQYAENCLDSSFTSPKQFLLSLPWFSKWHPNLSNIKSENLESVIQL